MIPLLKGNPNMSHPTKPVYLRPQQISTFLEIPISNVYALIRSCEIEAIDVSVSPNGKRPRWRVAKSSLDDFIARKTRTKPAAPAKATRRPARRQVPRHV